MSIFRDPQLDQIFDQWKNVGNHYHDERLVIEQVLVNVSTT